MSCISLGPHQLVLCDDTLQRKPDHRNGHGNESNAQSDENVRVGDTHVSEDDGKAPKEHTILSKHRDFIVRNPSVGLYFLEHASAEHSKEAHRGGLRTTMKHAPRVTTLPLDVSQVSPLPLFAGMRQQ